MPKRQWKRGGGGRGRGRDSGGSRGGGGSGGRDRWNYPRSEIDKSNEKYESYYNELAIVSEDERDQFWTFMKSDLPNSFRFAGSRGHALTVQRRLVDHYIPEITSVEYEGRLVSPPTPVQWYPDQLAWSMATPKNVIRKFPPFASFQKFLVSENTVGNITRQEVVSMIPPLMLDIKPHMTVLDLCAAPGSKSAQIIEMVHGGEEARVRKVLECVAEQHGLELSSELPERMAEQDQMAVKEDWSDDGRPTGLLVANDIDYRRAQMLVHQCKRLNSPNLIVVNHDATMFPSIKIPSESGNTYLKFDRILADVPCTGDGTCRKNPEIWKDWSQSKALGLHTTQVRILVRALQMLKIGGRVVYSTCSLNPIENEAVLSSAIDRCGGSEKIQIVDKDDALPGLKRRAGLTGWKVMDKAGRWWASWDDVVQTRAEQGEEGLSRVAEGMFPPSRDKDIALQHCTRIYPHLQDTGGFFIAVLEKKVGIKVRPESGQNAAEPQATPSITSVADEISERSLVNGATNLEKLVSLDDLAPPAANSASIEDKDNLQPVSRETDINGQESSGVPTLSHKRSFEDYTADTDSAIKRLKAHNEEESDPTPQNQGDRQMHDPPPPNASLDHTASDSTLQPPSEMQPPTSRPNHSISKRPNGGAPQEESFKYLSPSNPELASITAFYNLSPRFPASRFMVRNPAGEPVKSIYYTSALARDILTANEGTGIKFVHCGVKMFVKQDTQSDPDACKWRIQAEGLPIIEAWVGDERVVRMDRAETLRKLLVEMFPKVAGDGWRELGEVGERVKDLRMGCCVLRAEPGDNAQEDGGFAERFVMPLWRGAGSLNLMLPKEERRAMLLRLFNDETPLVDRSREKRLLERADATSIAASEDATQEASPDGQLNGGGAERNSSEGDGGVALPVDEMGITLDDPEQEIAKSAKVEDEIEGVENAAEAEMQDSVDKTREVAPGVVDEDERFNKTV